MEFRTGVSHVRINNTIRCTWTWTCVRKAVSVEHVEVGFKPLIWAEGPPIGLYWTAAVQGLSSIWAEFTVSPHVFRKRTLYGHCGVCAVWSVRAPRASVCPHARGVPHPQLLDMKSGVGAP